MLVEWSLLFGELLWFLLALGGFQVTREVTAFESSGWAMVFGVREGWAGMMATTVFIGSGYSPVWPSTMPLVPSKEWGFPKDSLVVLEAAFLLVPK